MTQEEFNAQWEKDNPLPKLTDPTEANTLGWSYGGRGPSKAQATEKARIEAEVAQDRAIKSKLDAQASRNAYAWKLREMKQRGKRY